MNTKTTTTKNKIVKKNRDTNTTSKRVIKVEAPVTPATILKSLSPAERSIVSAIKKEDKNIARLEKLIDALKNPVIKETNTDNIFNQDEKVSIYKEYQSFCDTYNAKIDNVKLPSVEETSDNSLMSMTLSNSRHDTLNSVLLYFDDLKRPMPLKYITEIVEILDMAQTSTLKKVHSLMFNKIKHLI